MDKTILETIREQRNGVSQELVALAAKPEMTAEEQNRFDELTAQFDTLDADVARREKAEEVSVKMNSGRGRVTSDEKVPYGSAARHTGKLYNHFGQFLGDVMAAGQGRVPARLQNAASTYGNEGTPGDGGYAVPTDFRRDIQSFVLGQDSLLARTDRYNSFSNILSFPTDTVQPWATTYGASGTLTEGLAYEEVKPALGTVSVQAGKLGVIVNVTDELMQDSIAMGAFVTRKVGERLVDRVNYCIIQGAGTNSTPYGFQASAACLTASKEVGQTGSNPLVAENLVKMFYSIPAQWRGDAVWLISDTVEPVLPTLKLSGATMFARPGDWAAGQATNTLLGKPVIVQPSMAALGEKGDIAFVSLSKYLALTKGDIATEMTPYLYWNQDIQSFKAHIRVGGKSWLTSPITLADGSTKRGPFVVLEKRN